mgnify:CR=1 FL=1
MQHVDTYISNKSLVYDELVRRSVTGHIEIVYETV